MSPTNIDSLYGELSAHIVLLDERFVNRHIPAKPAILPEEYSHDVRAYCILCHAAFEEYFESIATTMASFAVKQWKIARKINDIIPSLLCWHGAKTKIDEDENNGEVKSFDYLKPLIENAKTAFAKMIHDNHGISISYLRCLLIPVCVEIKQDANLLNSLNKLARRRGDYAHKWRAQTFLAPEDAKKYVSDVLEICADVKTKAINRLGQIS